MRDVSAESLSGPEGGGGVQEEGGRCWKVEAARQRGDLAVGSQLSLGQMDRPKAMEKQVPLEEGSLKFQGIYLFFFFTLYFLIQFLKVTFHLLSIRKCRLYSASCSVHP